MDIKDKVVIITGASSGIGRACAIDMFQHGARVVLASRSELELCRIADQIDPSGRRTLVVPVDVTDESQCANLIDETIAYFGQVDVLINNAGISMRSSLLDVRTEVLHRLMNVNFWGTVYCTKAALPHLLKTKGTIVGVSSVAGYLGLPGRTGYSASKYAMRGFLDAVRTEFLDRGIHVLLVAPGYTASNIRFSALTADGSPQGSTPRDEKAMMSAESVAKAIRKGILHNNRTKILTFVQGKFAVWLSKWWPSLVDRLTRDEISKENGK